MAADTNASLATNFGIEAYLNMQFFDLLHEVRDLKECATFVPFIPNSGSATVKLRFVQPVDTMTAPGEDTSSAIVNLTTANVTLTIAKYNLKRSIAELAFMTGEIAFAPLLRSFLKSVVYERSKLISALSTGFTGNTGAGTTLTPLSVDAIFSAKFALEIALASGVKHAMLKPKAFTEFQSSLRQETLTLLTQKPANQDLLVAGDLSTPVYDFYGIMIHPHDSVPTSGSDYVGAMVADSAIFLSEAPVSAFTQGWDINPQAIPGQNALIVQDVSTSAEGSYTWICKYYPGVAEGIDSAGVKITSIVA